MHHEDEFTSDAYYQGQRDRRDGSTINDNPYTLTAPGDAGEWADGFMDEHSGSDQEHKEWIKGKPAPRAGHLRPVVLSGNGTKSVA